MTMAMTAQRVSQHQRSVDESWDTLVHDLRNPLATAHAYVQLLRRRAARAPLQPNDLDQGLQHVEDAVTRIERLIDVFRDGPEVAVPGGTDLIELAHQVATQAQHAGGALQTIAVLPQTETLVGDWDRVDLERILSNLLENALKYSPAGRTVLVTIRREAGVAILRVADQGCGIPAPDLPHVFDRGYRAANATALAAGSGIGLATVRNIVGHYGGEISIDSQIGVGTTVTVQLPLQQVR